jgi:intracellular multiplication protein IcmJ
MIGLRPIELSLSADAFKKNDRQGNDGMIIAPSAFDPNADEETRQRIFERDNHTCQYCGFQSKKFNLVHVLDGEKGKARSDDNLVTSCIFCHQCFHLDHIGDMKSGVLIWMPELTQAQVNHVARSIYVARISQGPMAETARKALEMIMQRREETIERIKTDDPSIMSLVFKDYVTRDIYDRRHEKLDGIRVFPLDRRVIKEGDLEFNQFPQILAYWRSKDGPFAALNPNQWIDRYIDLKAAA